jgi:pilus assembly protein Flp/PilA
MKTLIKKFMREESGATMVEYGIMVALIAAIAIGTVATLGGYVDGAFASVNAELAPGGGGDAPPAGG